MTGINDYIPKEFLISFYNHLYPKPIATIINTATEFPQKFSIIENVYKVTLIQRGDSTRTKGRGWGWHSQVESLSGTPRPLSEPQADRVAGPTVGRAGGTWGHIYPPLPLVERKQSSDGQAEARGGERVGLTRERLPDPRLLH